MSSEKKLTLQNIQLIIKKYLNSENFKVLHHETSYENSPVTHISIKVKISIGNIQREVRFVAKPFLYPAQNHLEAPSCDSNLTPTYFIKDDVVILEDLSENGFTWAKQPQALDLDHIKLTLKTLAKYHAANIQCEEEKPENVEKDDEILQGPWFETIHALTASLTEQDLKENLTKIVKDSLKNIKSNCTVLCHGYMCGDGVLFKYTNNIPVECKLLNFGLQQYNPPGYDVLHFIYMVTNMEFRKYHLHQLLKFYYDCIKVELHKINLDSEELIPQEEDFEISIHHLLPLIKVQIAAFRQIQYLNPNFQNRIFEDVELVDKSENYTRMLTESISELKDFVNNPGLTIEDCFEIIRNKIGTKNYDLLNYEIKSVGKVSGFFGEHKKLIINIRLNNETQTLNFFLKFTPKGEAQKSIADDCGSFHKEHFFYRHFVPMAQKCGATMINDCTVPCYFTRLNDVLVFEDFEIRNYGILNHRQPLALEQVEITVKQLAKFHASSIILEEKLSEQTKTKYCLKENYEKGLQESFFTKTPNHQGAKSMDMSAWVLEDEIKLFPDPNSTLSDEDFVKKIRKVYKLVYELVKPSKEFRNAICHGDLWISNILVQQTNGKPMDCRLIDFQIMRYCPPAHDLLGFIYLTTNRSFRKAHMDNIINLYHGDLSKSLEKCGLEVEKIYPYENFIKSVEYMLPQSVCQTTIYYHICITNPDLMKDYMASEEQMKQIFLEDRRDFIVEMCKRDPLYKERNGEAIQDLRELCTKYF